MTTAIRDKIISYLGQGIQQSLVADAVGVTEGYVSQLLREPGVREEVAAKKAGTLEKDLAKDTLIEDVEMKALEQVKAKLTFAKLGEAANVFKIMNAARKKTVELPENDSAGIQLVTITMPKAGMVAIQLNTQNQVIEVAGRSMAPLPSRALPMLANEVKERSNQKATAADIIEKLRKADATTASERLANLVTVINGVALEL